MNEDMHIRAIEILEKDLSFDELNTSEKSIVLEAFGSEVEYHRMRGVTNLALEEEAIIAPSLRTETELLKEFNQKHSSQKSKGIGFWPLLSQLFKNPVVRYAIPVFVLIFGVVWFLNQSLLEEHNVSVAQNKETVSKERSDEHSDFRNEENKSFDNSNEEQVSGEFENSSDIKEGLTSKVEPNISPDFELEFQEDEETDEFMPSDGFAEKDISREMNDGLFKEHESAAGVDNIEEIREEEAMASEFQADLDIPQSTAFDTVISTADESFSNVVYSDDMMGNSVESLEEIAIQENKATSYKKLSKDRKYAASSVQSGLSDKSLHQFLYSTY